MRYPLSFRTAWFLAGLAALALVAACGGNNDDSGPTAAASVVCDGLAQNSYTYTSNVTTTVEEGPTPVPSGVVQGPPPLQFTQQADGRVEDGIDVSAQISNTDGVSNSDYDIIDLDGHAYANYGDGWLDQGTGQQANLIPYKPWLTCASLVEDIDLAGLSGEPETVNGVNATRYEVNITDSQFAARHPDLGGGSDVASYVKTYAGTLWVANDGYITKMDLLGSGEYPDGKPLKIQLTYEVADVGGDITVDAPI